MTILEHIYVKIFRKTAISGKFLRREFFSSNLRIYQEQGTKQFINSAVQIYNAKADFNNIPMFLVRLSSFTSSKCT